jgi:hypothetical protein
LIVVLFVWGKLHEPNIHELIRRLSHAALRSINDARNDRRREPSLLFIKRRDNLVVNVPEKPMLDRNGRELASLEDIGRLDDRCFSRTERTGQDLSYIRMVNQ